jgi:hypothetical protein
MPNYIWGLLAIILVIVILFLLFDLADEAVMRPL